MQISENLAPFPRCHRPLHLRHSLRSLQPSPTLCETGLHSSEWCASKNDKCEIPISENDAVITVIEDDCHATMFQCGSAQEKLAHIYHTKCDLHQDSFSTVRQHVFVHHFLAVVLQCNVVRCHSVDVCRTHHWKMRCEVWLGRDWSSRFIVNWRFLSSSSENIQSPSSTHPIVFTWNKIWLLCWRVWTCLLLSLSLIPVTFEFPPSRALVFTLVVGRLLVPTIMCFITILSTISTFTFESWVFCWRFHVTFTWVAFFTFVATLLILVRFYLRLFPFRETASTSIESSSWVFPTEVVLKMRLLLK